MTDEPTAGASAGDRPLSSWPPTALPRSEPPTAPLTDARVVRLTGVVVRDDWGCLALDADGGERWELRGAGTAGAPTGVGARVEVEGVASQRLESPCNLPVLLVRDVRPS